jgi:CRISPR-associated protein Cst1
VEIPKDVLENLKLDEVIDGIEKLALFNPFGGQQAYFSNTKRTTGTFREKLQNLLNLKYSEGRKQTLCHLCFNLCKTKYKLDSAYGNLFPAKPEKFPNNYRNFKVIFYLCPICSGLAYFHICGFTPLEANKSEANKGIFINAPSFKLIWLLNQHIEKLHSLEGYKDVKTLLGLSFIDLAVDLNIKLGTWQKLSTEILTLEKIWNEQKKKYEYPLYFYEIPISVLELLEDKSIASLLKELKNLELLKEFMNENFKIFEILAYKILRNPDKVNKDEFIKHYFPTISNPSWIANRLSRLYALINQHLKVPSEVLI